MFIKRKVNKMIANYFIIDDFLLKQLEKLDNHSLYTKIDNLLDNDDIYPCCDIDTIWNGLYFLISSKEDPIYDKTIFEDYAKSAFIFGDINFNTEEYIAYIKKDEIPKILEEIEKIKINEINFEPKVFDENQIFPNRWLKEDKELLKQELEMDFNELKDFFYKAKEINKNILITIM